MQRSVNVIPETVYSGLDLVAALIAWFSVRESGKPADDEYRFGHGKCENVAGTVEAMLNWLTEQTTHVPSRCVHGGQMDDAELYLNSRDRCFNGPMKPLETIGADKKRLKLFSFIFQKIQYYLVQHFWLPNHRVVTYIW